ncbi:MAG: TatD family hydrolase [Treponema sp.]|jgi:TatD DNase family protein|nr:TatD family hydrolase [Treponema sp.]
MNESIIDIGVNLMHPSFDKDREAVTAAAQAEGVSPLIITGTSVNGSRKAREYAALHPGKLYATAGVHPHDVKTCDAATLPALRELAAYDEVVAIGECGLDYNRDFSPRPVQREWFEKQAALAVELGMPLFLHERDASEDFTAILRAVGAGGTLRTPHSGAMPRKFRGLTNMVVHCFTGTEAELERYLELGAYIGITGWICDERRGQGLRSLVRRIPPDRLLIETDAPFLLPRDLEKIVAGEKRRSGRNEPRFLRHLARVIAQCQGKDEEQLAEETRENTRRFFGIARAAYPATGVSFFRISSRNGKIPW